MRPGLGKVWFFGDRFRSIRRKADPLLGHCDGLGLELGGKVFVGGRVLGIGLYKVVLAWLRNVYLKQRCLLL